MAPSKVVLVMKAEMKMAFKALLLVMGVAAAAVGAASKCSSRNGGEELTCQMRTLQSGLQASISLQLATHHNFFKETNYKIAIHGVACFTFQTCAWNCTKHFRLKTTQSCGVKFDNCNDCDKVGYYLSLVVP